MQKYVLYFELNNEANNAGPKACADALKIALENGYEGVKLYTSKKARPTVLNLAVGYLKTLSFARKLQEGDVVFIQYPMTRVLLKRIYKILAKRKVKIVTLIHDIDYLRNVSLGEEGVQGMKALELSLFSYSTVLIAHNEKMIAKLQEENLPCKYVSLDIFDYLYTGKNATVSEGKEVIIAGNLLKKKAGYLYQFNEKTHTFPVALYGSNLESGMEYPLADYRGSFPPEALIEQLKGGYGLVWDGPETTTCAGDYGQYLRINNPHKASLYIAAGLPLIVWKESALCPFIENAGVGFGVSSLDDLQEALLANEKNYEKYLHNANELQQQLRSGAFLKRALEKAERL